MLAPRVFGSHAQVALREPLVVCGVGFTLGALFTPLPLWVLAAAAVVALAALVRRRPAGPFLAALVAGSAVAALMLPPTEPLRDLARERAGHPHPLRARIVEIPERTAAGLSIIVQLEGGRARLAIDAPCGAVGDEIAGTVRLAPPHAPAMPAFRARSLTLMRGVAVTGGLTACEVITARSRPRWTASITDPLVRALTLADRGAPDPHELDPLLRAAGQSQLLALGGLWPLLLALALAALAPASLGKWGSALAAAITLGLLVAVGPTPTHLRVAALMAALLLSRGLGDPRFRARDALAITAAAISAIDPAGIGDNAFQLAFAASTAVIGVSALEGIGAAALPARAVTIALGAAVGTAPLVLRQFERLTLASLFADALTFPLAALTGVAGLFAPITAWPAEVGAATLRGIARALAGPGFDPLATPTVIECVLAYVALAAFTAQPRKTGAAALSFALLVLVAGAPRLERRWVAGPRVSVMATANGHAILVEADGRVVLAGLGDDDHPDPDAPARNVVQLLGLRGVDALDALMIDARTSTRTRSLVVAAHPAVVTTTAAAHVGGMRIVHVAGGLSIGVGDQELTVRSSTGAGGTSVWSSPSAPPVVIVGDRRWPTAVHGLITLEGSPWSAAPYRGE